MNEFFDYDKRFPDLLIDIALYFSHPTENASV